MGGTTAPVSGSAVLPAWMARVSKFWWVYASSLMPRE